MFESVICNTILNLELEINAKENKVIELNVYVTHLGNGK